jgi:hypothetical protein
MSDQIPSRPSADCNLLFGFLALQMDLISRDALIAAMGAWVLEKAKPLGQILVEQGHGCVRDASPASNTPSALCAGPADRLISSDCAAGDVERPSIVVANCAAGSVINNATNQLAPQSGH